MRKLFPGLLTLFFVCFFTIHVFAESQADWKKAGELIQEGNYSGALTEIDSLLVKRPDDALLLRLKGICLTQSGDIEGAVAALRQGLKKDPENVASRYYLAQALAYRGSISLAIDLLKEVQQKAPDSRYAEQAARVLPELERLSTTAQALTDAKRWNLTLRLGTEHDDNVLGQSRHETPASKDDSFRLVSSTYVELRPIDQSIDHTPFTLGLGYAIYQSWHERDEVFQKFDLTSQTGKLFLRRGDRLWGKPYRFEVSGNYTNTRLANNSYNEEGGLATSFDYQWIDWAMVSPNYSIQWKDFANDTTIPNLYSMDGYEQSVGVSNRFYTFNHTVVFNGSYVYRWSKTDGSQFDYDGHEFAGTAGFSLPWKFDLAAGISYQTQTYTKYDPVPRRMDDTYSVFTSVSHPLWNENWLIQFNYKYSMSNSSLEFSEYTRQVFGAAVSYYV